MDLSVPTLCLLVVTFPYPIGASGPPDRLAQRPQLAHLILELVAGLSAAGVRQEPQPGVAQPLRLLADSRVRAPERDPVRGEAENGHDARLPALRLAGQVTGSSPELVRVEIAGRCGCPADEVGDAQACGEEKVLLAWRKQLLSEPRRVQRFPEPVAWAGEVVPDRA